MKRFVLLCLVLLLTIPAVAQPPLVAATATAEGDVRKPVVIEVKVSNRGKAPTAQANLVVVCTPKVSGASRGGGDTLQDPMELAQMVPPLQPGEEKVLQLRTPYESAGAFRGRRGTFRANNISPTGEVTIEFKAQVR